MKKIFFLGLCLYASWQMANAQIENRLSIGPRAGANFSNINSDNSKNHTGLLAGITSTYSFNEKSGLTVDLLYSGEGYKSGNLDVALNYLKIPILYNMFFGQLGEAFRPKIYVGVAPGFLLSANANDNDIKDQYKSVVFDLVGGLGFNYRLADRIWLNVDLRAFLGLSAVGESGDAKNRTFQPSLGIAYGL
jgi:outer membrane protein W